MEYDADPEVPEEVMHAPPPARTFQFGGCLLWRLRLPWRPVQIGGADFDISGLHQYEPR